MNILKAVNLRKIYGQGETEVKALDGVNLEVEKGEFVAIVGTSGSGKSTMLHIIGGLDNPTSGQVIVDGQNLSHMTDEELTIFRRRNIGFVFQQYNLVPMLNVWENIILPVKLDGKKVEKGYVDEIIDTLGIRTKLENLPSALSGGQQQRVAIARALAAKPAILLADEPTGNLDSKTSQDVLGLLKVTSKRFHQTIVMITHNEEIAQMADRILQIEDGKVQFFLEIFYRRNMGHVGVMPGMVSHGVSFFYYLSDQFRLRVNVGSDNKKSGFYLMFFQCIKDGRCISVFVTGIKSKIQNFFRRILCVISIHRCKFLDRSISNRSFAFFLKT